MMKKTLIIFSLIIISFQTIAQEEYGISPDENLPQGLNIGDKAPVIKAHDIHGNLFDSRTVLKDKDIIVIFYRGQWCSACDRYLSNLSDSLDYLLQKGAVVVAITPETPVNALKTKDKTNAEFIILSDHTEEIMDGFDVIFEVTEEYHKKVEDNHEVSIAENNGKEESRLPIPATFVIHHDGTISFKHFDFDYNNRASVAELIAHFD